MGRRFFFFFFFWLIFPTRSLDLWSTQHADGRMGWLFTRIYLTKPDTHSWLLAKLPTVGRCDITRHVRYALCAAFTRTALHLFTLHAAPGAYRVHCRATAFTTATAAPHAHAHPHWQPNSQSCGLHALLLRSCWTHLI